MCVCVFVIHRNVTSVSRHHHQGQTLLLVTPGLLDSLFSFSHHIQGQTLLLVTSGLTPSFFFFLSSPHPGRDLLTFQSSGGGEPCVIGDGDVGTAVDEGIHDLVVVVRHRHVHCSIAWEGGGGE